ncbi:MAG: hypothetical protein ACKO96_13680 [Flammeovirgaceae bacterium]
MVLVADQQLYFVACSFSADSVLKSKLPPLIGVAGEKERRATTKQGG